VRPDRTRGGLSALQEQFDQLTPEEKRALLRYDELEPLDQLDLLGGWNGIEALAIRLYLSAPDDSFKELTVDNAGDVHAAVLTLQENDTEKGLMATHLADMEVALAHANRHHGGVVAHSLAQAMRYVGGGDTEYPHLVSVHDQRGGPRRLLCSHVSNSKSHLVRWVPHYKSFQTICGHRARGTFSIGLPLMGNPGLCKNCLKGSGILISCGPA